VVSGIKMSSSLAPVWFNFFLEAGIPPSDAGNYAVTFTQNRIQPDMMTDLTKEYLAEMGITVLGDVIAILKHARVVHTQVCEWWFVLFIKFLGQKDFSSTCCG
jgi:SAM domain (Sterile alpha motif)